MIEDDSLTHEGIAHLFSSDSFEGQSFTLQVIQYAPVIDRSMSHSK